jgi:hypothetical protein
VKIGVVSGIGGIAILAALTVAVFGWSSAATAEFTFPATDGKGTMTYRCQVAETFEETEHNARAAHAFFEPVLLESARVYALALAESMLPGRPSAEIAAEVDVINDESEAIRKAIHRNFEQQFRCRYLGST